MGMSAILTLSAMLNYRPDIFDNLVLPAAPNYQEMGVEAEQVRAAWTISKDDFAEFLALKSMGMSLAVPDADWLKAAIGVWSKAHIHEWQRMFDTLFYKYNPIWNKDSTITETIENEYDTVDTQRPDITITNNGNNTGYTNGYNSGTQTIDGLQWTHADKTIGNASNRTTGSSTLEKDGTETHERTLTEKGNIGVTQVQQMIDAERETAKYSFEDWLADEFKKEFCLMIW